MWTIKPAKVTSYELPFSNLRSKVFFIHAEHANKALFKVLFFGVHYYWFPSTVPQMATKLTYSVTASFSGSKFPNPIFLVATNGKNTKRIPLRKLPLEGNVAQPRVKLIFPDKNGSNRT